ncbi:MAG: hypothetical protein MUD11_16970 [Rhodobacteraceae bacterium]|jgi:hypothetical protein|nr:hypothetical protein [Paracoccaceae bacterium]
MTPDDFTRRASQLEAEQLARMAEPQAEPDQPRDSIAALCIIGASLCCVVLFAIAVLA